MYRYIYTCMHLSVLCAKYHITHQIFQHQYNISTYNLISIVDWFSTLDLRQIFHVTKPIIYFMKGTRGLY
jgi:hypothetical protein